MRLNTARKEWAEKIDSDIIAGEGATYVISGPKIKRFVVETLVRRKYPFTVTSRGAGVSQIILEPNKVCPTCKGKGVIK